MFSVNACVESKGSKYSKLYYRAMLVMHEYSIIGIEVSLSSKNSAMGHCNEHLLEITPSTTALASASHVPWVA